MSLCSYLASSGSQKSGALFNGSSLPHLIRIASFVLHHFIYSFYRWCILYTPIFWKLGQKPNFKTGLRVDENNNDFIILSEYLNKKDNIWFFRSSYKLPTQSLNSFIVSFSHYLHSKSISKIKSKFTRRLYSFLSELINDSCSILRFRIQNKICILVPVLLQQLARLRPPAEPHTYNLIRTLFQGGRITYSFESKAQRLFACNSL